MKKTTLLKNLAYIAIGIVFAIGASYLYAATSGYSDPSGAPPANNPATPLNVGTADQIKMDTVCATGSCAGLSLGGAFFANQNAALDQQTFINGLMLGGTPGTDGTLAFGGKDPASPLPRGTSLQISGGIDTSLAMQSDTLKNTAGNTGLCANAAGQVVLCNIDICSNIAGTQLAVPAGDTANADGTCSPATKEFFAALQSLKDYTKFGGGVVNDGYLTMHDPNVNNQGYGYPKDGVDTLYLPYIDGIGLDNDQPAGWIINQIPGVQGNQLAEGQPALLDVVEAGSYNFNLQYNGQFSAAGKDANNDQFFGLDFYFQIHHHATDSDTYVPLDTAMFHENYPVIGDNLTLDYLASDSGATYTYFPYSFTFNNTYTLQPGDQVFLHAFIYGVSGKTGFLDTNGDFFNSAGDYKNFNYDIQANAGSTIKIIETPQ